MQLNQWMSLMLSLLLFPYSAWASNLEQVQLPRCLAEQMPMKHQVLAENKEFKIIELASSDIEKLVLLADQVQCGRFINLSPEFSQSSKKSQLAQSLLNQKAIKPGLNQQILPESFEVKHHQEVNEALKEVKGEPIWDTLSRLISFSNRSATKTTGLETAQWLKNSFEAKALEYGRKDTEAFFIKTPGYKQPSVVTVIGKDLKAPALVIGAHMDTLDGSMPGADDDGSGSASIMEAARVLLANPLPLKRPIYIIWYAAEERGLVGSKYVVQHFRQQAIPVKAVVQFDMTGYRVRPEDPTMWLYTDYTNKTLNQYLAQLIETYLHVPLQYSTCGYGCSDHASWTEQGVPAAFPCETSFKEHNPYIHTPSDKIDLVNLEHMTHFSQLAVAFALELGLE